MVNNTYGILLSTAKVALCGIFNFLLRDALNQMKDNKMSEKDAMDCALQVSKGVQ